MEQPKTLHEMLKNNEDITGKWFVINEHFFNGLPTKVVYLKLVDEVPKWFLHNLHGRTNPVFEAFDINKNSYPPGGCPWLYELPPDSKSTHCVFLVEEGCKKNTTLSLEVLQEQNKTRTTCCQCGSKLRKIQLAWNFVNFCEACEKQD